MFIVVMPFTSLSAKSQSEFGVLQQQEVNVFSSCTLGYLGGLLLVFPFAAIHDCVPLSTGVDQALCLDGSAGQLVA